MIVKLLDLKAYAKVNLTLDIVGTREDGYHLLESIFHEVPIYDTINLLINRDGIIDVICTTEYPTENVPMGQDNIAYKTAKKFFEAIGDTTYGVTIIILKRIPMQAGMGGGSSDAGCILKSLNAMFENPLSDEQLIQIASTIGADVPFFIHGGTAYATNVGDVIKPLKPLPKLNMVVAKGNDGISTIEAYHSIDALESIEHIDNVKALQCIESQDIAELCKCCGNVFEQIPLPKEVSTIKDTMLQCNALCSVMTGSGSAVFGIFNTPEEAKRCYDTLQTSTKYLI